MSTIIQDLNDHERHTVSSADALVVAKQYNIVRFIWSDFGWIQIDRGDLISRLSAWKEDVALSKAFKFAHYYFRRS